MNKTKDRRAIPSVFLYPLHLRYKTQKSTSFEVLFGAATQIRTGDLILTKDVLYQLSHSSISTDISAEQ